MVQTGSFAFCYLCLEGFCMIFRKPRVASHCLLAGRLGFAQTFPASFPTEASTVYRLLEVLEMSLKARDTHELAELCNHAVPLPQKSNHVCCNIEYTRHSMPAHKTAPTI